MIWRYLLAGALALCALLAETTDLRLTGGPELKGVLTQTAFPTFPVPRESATISQSPTAPLPVATAPVFCEPLALRTNEIGLRLLDGAMLGGLVMMALLGLLLLAIFRDRAFLFNALATATYCFGELSAKGYGFIYLWPSASDWAMRSMPMYTLLGVGLNILFLRDLLLTRSAFPYIDRLLLALLAIEWFPAPGILFGDLQTWATWSLPLHFPITVVMALVGVYAVHKGVRAAWFYTAGYVVLAVGSLVQGLTEAGVSVSFEISRYALPLSMLVNNLLLLTSVVERIIDTRKGREAAQNALLAARAAHEEQLNRAVEERTADLNAALIATRKASQTQARLVAYISHDLRAPLATIVNSARLLGRNDGADLPRHKDTIERSAMHQLELIDDLVEYARGELDHIEVVPAPTYLYDWLDGIAGNAELLAAENDNRFLLSASVLPAVVVFDPKRLRQVVINLIANAAKFTRAGEIRLNLHSTPLIGGQVALQFSVDDTGSGIHEADLERIFLPFERRMSDREGYGLGLSIARQLVRVMGGELAVTSDVGKGSRFSFRLVVPTVDEAEVMPSAQPFALPESFGTGKTILVADDNPSSREHLREVLASADFDVIVVADGTEALRLALERDFNAVLVDQFMPGLSGWDVLRALREVRVRDMPPVFLCSAMPPQRPAGYPDDIRFEDTLLKPVTADKLLRRLMNFFVHQSPPVPPAETRVPTELLAQLRGMVAQGQISDIEQWALTLASQHAEWASFATLVSEAALRIDLAELERLASQ